MTEAERILGAVEGGVWWDRGSVATGAWKWMEEHPECRRIGMSQWHLLLTVIRGSRTFTEMKEKLAEHLGHQAEKDTYQQQWGQPGLAKALGEAFVQAGEQRDNRETRLKEFEGRLSKEEWAAVENRRRMGRARQFLEFVMKVAVVPQKGEEGQ